MREKVVCNASPLIFLAKIERLDLLNAYELHLPQQVEAEILKGSKSKREDSGLIAQYLKANKIEPVKIPLLKDLPHSLGTGERAVISLAVKEGIKRVLIDESKARTVARFKGLKPKGTLGVLWDAHRTGRIDNKTLEILMLGLIQRGYRIKEEILVEFLKKIKG